MYEKYKFLEEKIDKVQSVREALEIAQGRKYEVTATTFGDLRVSDSGLVKVAGEEQKMTQVGFEKLCGLLGIPRPFARKIPEDLLNENIQRLLKEKDGKKVNLFGTKRGLIGISASEMLPFSSVDFLTQVLTLKQGDTELTPEEVSIGDYGVLIHYFLPGSIIEVIKDDKLKLGFEIQNSEAGLMPTVARSYIYRPICENGAYGTTAWGMVRASSMKKVKAESRLLKFIADVGKMPVSKERFEKCFKRMEKTNVTDTDFRKYWQSTKKILGSAKDTDELMKIKEEERKALFNEVNVRAKASRRLDGADITPQEMDITYYETYNRVTEVEKRLPIKDAIKVRLLGGQILTNFFKSQVTEN